MIRQLYRESANNAYEERPNLERSFSAPQAMAKISRKVCAPSWKSAPRISKESKFSQV
jgi:hypothetical protein